ncbi:amino acid adenylation domain-containing protein [Streptomyces sp. SL13]|uniref:Amino acid adenylation domain-containing protein n=1 Tax=Streptantibioticus silvisoli TaxID=2705255 RepID=A0AA90KGQ0_9ACTN|nr:non-ribosomal peptide synthetase [Streptantibioticus silvisoli]MDI5970845.1 amino acid adenylation domain-containing protein [Streptantibioticus silvisoli]
MTRQATGSPARPDTLLRRFDLMAGLDPSATAVRAGTSALSYQALADASRALAARLAPVLDGRPGPVAVLLEPGPGQLTAALAALRCGKPYLPIDPAYPPHRVDRILADAAPAALIAPGGEPPPPPAPAPSAAAPAPAAPGGTASGGTASGGTASRATAADPASGGTASRATAGAPGAAEPLRVTAGVWGDATRVTGDDAYVIYTSGSTGTPKGVVIGHRGILNLLDAFQARRALPPRSRHSTCASPGFDAAVLETWTALSTGGELLVAPDSRRWNPEGFADWLARERVAHAYIPAAFLPALADGLRHGLDLGALRRVVVAVEPIPRGLLGAIGRALPDLTLINGYGPTEASVCVTMYEVTEADDGPERTPIGTAVPGIRLLVEPPATTAAAQDEAAHEVADGPGGGVRGELHIGGVGVGRHLRPDPAGRSAFYTRPAEDGTPVPYYRTGDLVRRDPDGCYTFLGRVDDMVKIRGYRVEPGDVEHALLDQPGLTQAVVLKRSPDPGAPAGRAEQLVAYVVPAPGTSPDLPGIYRRLRATLPWYAVPHRIEPLDAFPLTPHGKIDRKALAAAPLTPAPPPLSGDAPVPLAPAPQQPSGEAPVPPDGDALLRVWRDALGADGDLRVSFLANGGDSLAAGRTTALLLARLGKRVRVLDVLLAQDLEGLRATVGDAPDAVPGDDLPQGVPPARQAGSPVPATYGQRGLWFHDALHPGSAVYNEPLALRLRGPLDTGALSRAIGAVVERHEALRTGLVMSGGTLGLVVRPPGAQELTTRDLRDVPAARRADAVAQAVRETVRQPFDLAAGPHLRCHLVTCGEQDHLLVLALHHSAFDGGSADVLFEELAALYSADVRGEDATLAPEPGRYADHALRQHALITGGHLAPDLAYWRDQLAGLPQTLDLPGDVPRPRTPAGEGALVRDRLPRALTERVDALARDAAVTRYTVLLSALHILLARYCGTEDVAVGAPFSGRDLPGTERSVGYYLNTLPLRADLRGAPTFRQLLARTRRTVTDAYTHQRVPYGYLLERLGAAAPAENPYLQVCLVPEDVYRHEMTFAGVGATFEYYDTGVAKFDLTVNLIPDPGGGLRLTAEYRTDLFGGPAVERLLGHLRTLLESATARPDDPVDRLGMLPDAERARILRDFAGEAAPAPQPAAAVHQLVDRRAQSTPDAIAVVAGAEQLTYRQLIDRADQLAYYLAERGAEPGTRVGVRLPRCASAVVAFLAVLKTGAAYVPLDPAYPERRLAFMADDAGLVLELTPHLLDADREEIADGPQRPPAVAVTGQDAAYVIYTSGSTGRPKGVETPHRAVADLALGAAGWARIDERSRLLLVASLSFDMVTFDIWAALANGARLVLAPPGPLGPGGVAEAFTRHAVTHADLPTAVFHRQAEEDPYAFAGLDTLIAGGEVLDPGLAARVLAAAPDLRLINGYGPTEATTYATYHVLRGGDGGDGTGPVPLGRPTPGTRVRILDLHRQPAPVGVPGELHLGGPGLALGYLNRPDLTAERFGRDPYGAPGETLYATGDLARWRPGGTIEHTGRIDGQVKLYGHRVEPGEVEAVLRAHPDVTHAVVTRREDRPGTPYLAAYYTTADGNPLPARELTDLAAARLPAYMVPRVFTVLDRVPVTASGKTDRAALPPPAAAHAAVNPPQGGAPGTGAGQDPPAGGPAAVQERIAAIWREILVLDTVGPDERLFDIGGASLHVTLIHQRVTRDFGLPELRMIDLFSHPTLRAYAAHVHRLSERPGPAPR